MASGGKWAVPASAAMRLSEPPSSRPRVAPARQTSQAPRRGSGPPALRVYGGALAQAEAPAGQQPLAGLVVLAPRGQQRQRGRDDPQRRALGQAGRLADEHGWSLFMVD